MFDQLQRDVSEEELRMVELIFMFFISNMVVVLVAEKTEAGVNPAAGNICNL